MEDKSMFQYRAIDVRKDRDLLLEFHCRINYESETPHARTTPYDQYREKWLSTSQPEAFLSHLAETLKDIRTMVEILECNGSVAGYLWVTFSDIQDYSITIAEVMDIAVMPDYRRRGVGSDMLKHIEETARERGATLLRSDTGIDNVASQKLHERFGFKTYRICYEKIIG